LTALLQDADADVAQAAARAMGKIGTKEAAKALQKALPDVPAANQLAFCEALFRCAENMDFTSKEASGIYEQMLKLSVPHQVRAGAVRGAIINRHAAYRDQEAYLRQQLRNPDYIVFAAAVRAAMEFPGAVPSSGLVAELPQLSPDRQIVVIQCLGKLKEQYTLRALLASVKAGDKAVRMAAVRAIPELGDAHAVPVLIELMADADREIGQAAQEGLASFRGDDVDNAVVSMLSSSETAQRLTAIDLIGRRRMTSCIPALLKAAEDTDAKVRPAALKRLGELGGPDQIPALLDLLARTKGAPDLDATEQALGALCAKAENPESHTERLAGLLAQAAPPQKSSLLRVLTAIGGDRALKAVRAAVDDSNAEVHAAAIRALGAWKTADAAPELLALARAASDATDKMLCLRSFLGWAAQSDLPPARRLAMCQQAASLVQRDDEKKLLLSALGSIMTLDSLAQIVPYLEQAATKEEASAAVVGIAEKLLQGRNAPKLAPKLIEPLKKVGQTTANADLARRAKALLEQAQTKASGK
jgi:HEAT repeat protein